MEVSEVGSLEVSSAAELVRVPGGPSFRREKEARRARHRLYPVTLVYTTYSLTVLGFGVASKRPAAAVFAFSLGLVVWTLVEYLVHRYVLHGRFPCCVASPVAGLVALKMAEGKRAPSRAARWGVPFRCMP